MKTHTEERRSGAIDGETSLDVHLHEPQARIRSITDEKVFWVGDLFRCFSSVHNPWGKDSDSPARSLPTYMLKLPASVG